MFEYFCVGCRKVGYSEVWRSDTFRVNIISGSTKNDQSVSDHNTELRWYFFRNQFQISSAQSLLKVSCVFFHVTNTGTTSNI